jgi:hypothetical protein
MASANIFARDFSIVKDLKCACASPEANVGARTPYKGGTVHLTYSYLLRRRNNKHKAEVRLQPPARLRQSFPGSIHDRINVFGPSGLAELDAT